MTRARFPIFSVDVTLSVVTRRATFDPLPPAPDDQMLPKMLPLLPPAPRPAAHCAVPAIPFRVRRTCSY